MLKSGLQAENIFAYLGLKQDMAVGEQPSLDGWARCSVSLGQLETLALWLWALMI